MGESSVDIGIYPCRSTHWQKILGTTPCYSCWSIEHLPLCQNEGQVGWACGSEKGGQRRRCTTCLCGARASWHTAQWQDLGQEHGREGRWWAAGWHRIAGHTAGTVVIFPFFKFGLTIAPPRSHSHAVSLFPFPISCNSAFVSYLFRAPPLFIMSIFSRAIDTKPVQASARSLSVRFLLCALRFVYISLIYTHIPI